jgi:hypothetical protein
MRRAQPFRTICSVDANGGVERILFGHTLAAKLVVCGRIYKSVFTCIIKYYMPAFIRQVNRALFVSHLKAFFHPQHVIGFIVSIHVAAFECKAIRRTHVCDKTVKGSHRSVYGYTSSTVILVPIIFRVFAAAYHVNPSRILRAWFTSNGMSVCALYRSHHLAFETATAFAVAAAQISCGYAPYGAAVTHAQDETRDFVTATLVRDRGVPAKTLPDKGLGRYERWSYAGGSHSESPSRRVRSGVRPCRGSAASQFGMLCFGMQPSATT